NYAASDVSEPDMCGIAGFYSLDPLPEEAAVRGTIARMTAALASRGPDEQDEWCDRTAGIALGHRRLAVIDPSPAGHQPMTSPSGRYVMVYNGEAYNHLVLREELGERAWRGHSDTETLLACFDAFGIEPTLKRAVGMFAFA